MILPEDLKQLLLAFNAHGVDYLVIGGYAVGVYAEPRATKDLDLFIRADIRNSEAVYRALAAFGAPLAGLTPADFRDDPNSIFQIGQPPARVDDEVRAVHAGVVAREQRAPGRLLRPVIPKA